MRRTTICRSKASVALALTLLGAASLRAQQTPPAAPAQQPAEPQQQATPPAGLPATHLVQSGETLWGLAQQYFGDPLLWPEIYRLNTDVVEDPHWIYPGEELRLTAPATLVAEQPPQQETPTIVAVTPQADSTQPAPEPRGAPAPDAPTIFSRVNRQNLGAEAIEVTARPARPAVSEGQYYSAPFLTEGEALPAGRVLGSVQPASIQRITTSTSAQQFTDVIIAPPDDNVRAGEVLLAVARSRVVPGFGNVILPTGLLQVRDTARTNGRIVARVVRIYRAIDDGQEVLRVTPYAPDTTPAVAVTEGGIDGEIIGLADPGEVVHIADAVFLNKGAADGVKAGDTFQLSGADRRGPGFADAQLLQAEAVVTNVRPHTATLIITRLQRSDVRAGTTARQVRRIPS